MLNFQVACAQKFQTKNNFFWRCQQIWNVVIKFYSYIRILERMIRRKY